MSHPRAVYPSSIAGHYRLHGGVATCAAYGTSWLTLRRWLVEHGVEIRPQGLRLGRKLVGGGETDPLTRKPIR